MYKERICEDCGKKYLPNSPRQRYCFDCLKRYEEERQKRFIRTCQICGKQFYRKRSSYKCDDKHPGTCVICGKYVEDDSHVNRDYVTCSKECRERLRQNHIQETSLKRHGFKTSFSDKKTREKIKQTNLKRYGSASTFGNEQIRSKIRQTMKERYGVEYTLSNEKLREQARQTMQERYGAPTTLESDVLNEKVKNTLLERYGVDHNFKCPEIYQKCMNTVLERYGVSHPFQTEQNRRAVSKALRHKISKLNVSFHDFLEQNGVETEFEFFISPRSFDLKVIDKNILIEVNPSITHNSLFSIFDKSSEGLNRKYHYRKTRLANKHGYICINVWDWSGWEELLDIIKNPDNYEISQLSSPRKCWSKGKEMFYQTDEINEVSYINEGWLLVYDDGQEIRKKV